MPSTILLVDDEETVRDYLAKLLEVRGHNVLKADCGPAGLEIFSQPRHIDLLITDCAMETMTGFELAVRTVREHPEIRVLFISGYAGSEILRRYGAKVDGLPFLQKPFSPNEFVEAAESLLKSDPISRDQIRQLASITG